MIEITLKDPGMYDKTVKIRTWAELGPTLHKYDHAYTTAVVVSTEEMGNPSKIYRRVLGERVWRCGPETL